MSMLSAGDFVRVRADADFRAGQDGLVVAAPDADGVAGLIFGFDCSGEPVMSKGCAGAWPTPCEGIEAWHVGELDLATADRREA